MSVFFLHYLQLDKMESGPEFTFFFRYLIPYKKQFVLLGKNTLSLNAKNVYSCSGRLSGSNATDLLNNINCESDK